MSDSMSALIPQDRAEELQRATFTLADVRDWYVLGIRITDEILPRLKGWDKVTRKHRRRFQIARKRDRR